MRISVKIRTSVVLMLGLGMAGGCLGQQRQRPVRPEPTYANVPYGNHPRQVVDFWTAGPGPKFPLAVYVHGGGFTGGSKDGIRPGTIRTLLAAGIHVASIEYRVIADALLPAAHEDVVRAIQFLRSKSNPWSIDKDYVGAFGGSAGAQLVAYLAWHDDMANPESEDPIARESTRLACVAPLNGQATMDLDWWIENIPGYDEKHKDMEAITGLEGKSLQGLVDEISIINHISSDDPPVYMRYGMKPDDPVPERNPRGWSIHHVNFGLAMDEKLKAAGVQSNLVYPGLEDRSPSLEGFLVEHLAWRSNRQAFTEYESRTFGAGDESLRYSLLRPRHFDPSKKYPLVLFLHGSGGRGPAGIRNLVDADVPAYLASDEVHGKYDAFWVVPQCPGPNAWSRNKKLPENRESRPTVDHLLIGLVDEVMASHPIDRTRLYVTGLSMGGEGTFGQVALRPDFWAAAAPVCAKWAADEAESFTGQPMWLFHGAMDPAVRVEYSRTMHKAINAAGGNVRYTEYPDVKHNSWINAYHDPEIWQWLFAQHR